ncbi:hypothetical protein WG66_003089 [Moniliophthora roreri]|nr:hypothetical protein WG66_003089 [Moniliophthora roreri]
MSWNSWPTCVSFAPCRCIVGIGTNHGMGSGDKRCIKFSATSLTGTDGESRITKFLESFA